MMNYGGIGMTEKRFDLVCASNLEWLMQSELFLPIRDKNTNKEISLKQCFDLLNSLAQDEQLKEENKELKKQLKREETDKKRLMSYLMRYKGFGFDEIVDDYFNEPYYDNWWEDGFYERCWDDYLKEKGFDGCDEE